MTPKEALEKILSYVKLDEYDYVTSGVLDAEQLIKQALTELEELKRYPTSEEVCKAYFKATNWHIRYDKETHSFMLGGLIVAIKSISGVAILLDVPPHLITLIGRFYKSMEVKSK